MTDHVISQKGKSLFQNYLLFYILPLKICSYFFRFFPIWLFLWIDLFNWLRLLSSPADLRPDRSVEPLRKRGFRTLHGLHSERLRPVLVRVQRCLGFQDFRYREDCRPGGLFAPLQKEGHHLRRGNNGFLINFKI